MSGTGSVRRTPVAIALRAVLRVVALWVGLFGAYFLMPDTLLEGRNVAIVVVILVLLFAGACVLTARVVLRSDLPRVAAAESAGFLIPFYLVLFALLSLAMSAVEPRSFTERLSHTGALYYTVTMFATVGFGDITPVTEVARNVATVQMLLNLVVLGVVVKAILAVGRAAGAERKVHE